MIGMMAPVVIRISLLPNRSLRRPHRFSVRNCSSTEAAELIMNCA
jgi:hypothetical protein